MQDKSTEDQEDSKNQEVIMIDASSSDDQGDGKDLMLSCDTEEDVTAEVVLKKFVEDSDMSSDDQWTNYTVQDKHITTCSLYEVWRYADYNEIIHTKI